MVLIQKYFLKCCISNNLDGTEDDAEIEDSDAATENEDQDEKYGMTLLFCFEKRIFLNCLSKVTTIQPIIAAN